MSFSTLLAGFGNRHPIRLAAATCIPRFRRQFPQPFQTQVGKNLLCGPGDRHRVHLNSTLGLPRKGS